MSLTQSDVQKLASLSRMKLSDEEAAQFTKEIDAILGYVEQIKEVSAGEAAASAGVHANPPLHRNMMREDIADQNLNPDSSEVLSRAPSHQDGLVKVKKILG
ncbi:MAG TPA: Asp-tRNA(Asn)/Glu-tRNA(Gln) amidotransferase subunit GatC [Candidatus Paceibacterota bacterium]